MSTPVGDNSMNSFRVDIDRSRGILAVEQGNYRNWRKSIVRGCINFVEQGKKTARRFYFVRSSSRILILSLLRRL